jgi:aspartate kinase
LKIAKFGGTSLADAVQIRKVCDIILSDSDRRIIVVSAPGKRSDTDMKVTDLLIAAAEACLRGRDGRGEMEHVITRFTSIAQDLGIPEEIPMLRTGLEALLDADRKNPARFTDLLKATGEDTMAKLLAAYLSRQGHPAQYIHPGDAGMRMTDEYGNARLLEDSYESLANLAELSGIVVHRLHPRRRAPRRRVRKFHRRQHRLSR